MSLPPYLSFSFPPILLFSSRKRAKMTSDDDLVVRTFFGLKSIIGNFRRRVKRRRGVDAVGAAMFAGVQKSEIVPMLILFLCFVVIPLTSSSTLTSASDVENHELKRLKESFKDLLTTNDIRQLFPAKNVASVDDVGSKRVKRSRGTSLQNNNIDDDDDDDDTSVGCRAKRPSCRSIVRPRTFSQRHSIRNGPMILKLFCYCALPRLMYRYTRIWDIGIDI